LVLTEVLFNNGWYPMSEIHDLLDAKLC